MIDYEKKYKELRKAANALISNAKLNGIWCTGHPCPCEKTSYNDCSMWQYHLNSDMHTIQNTLDNE